MEKQWIKVADMLPAQNKVVETKIDNQDGIRNIQDLKFSSNLWWLPNGSMYVYYTPTHWREKD